MELAQAYPLAGKRYSYRRSVDFDKINSRITLTDCTDCGNVILNFITYEKPQITEEGKLWINGAEVNFCGASLEEIETLPITDPRLQTAWDHDLYRIRLKMEGTEFRMEIS